MKWIMAAFFSLMMGFSAVAQTIEERIIGGFILPTYEHFIEGAGAQKHAMSTLCEMPNASNLQLAQEAFSQLVMRWGRAEIIRFGPVMQENRLERILFWPDRKSIGLKQTQQAIFSNESTVIELEALQKKSVALQGLGALEFILFGTDFEQLATNDGAFRCAFGLTVAQAIEATGIEILAAWQGEDGFANILKSSGAQNPYYREHSEIMRELLEVVAYTPMLIHDAKLKSYLGDDISTARPKSILFWRSDLSFQMIKANLEGLHDFIEVANFDERIADEHAWVINSYLFELKNAINALPVDVAALDAATEETSRSKLDYFELVMRSMNEIAASDLANALELSVGFSSLDGD